MDWPPILNFHIEVWNLASIHNTLITDAEYILIYIMANVRAYQKLMKVSMVIVAFVLSANISSLFLNTNGTTVLGRIASEIMVLHM